MRTFLVPVKIAVVCIRIAVGCFEVEWGVDEYKDGDEKTTSERACTRRTVPKEYREAKHVQSFPSLNKTSTSFGCPPH